MSDSFIALPLGIGGFSRGPCMARSPVCAPATLIVPVGWTVFSPRSRMSGFLEAPSTVFQTTSISSPTFAVAGAVTATFVVPSTGGSPDIGGGRHSVLYDTSAAWAVPAAAMMPAPASTMAAAEATAALLRCLITLNLSTSVVRLMWWWTVRCPG